MSKEQDAVEQAREHLDKHTKWRTEYALKQVEEERKRKEGRSAGFSKVVVDDANYWIEDLEEKKDKKINRRYRREGADIHVEGRSVAVFDTPGSDTPKLPPPPKK